MKVEIPRLRSLAPHAGRHIIEATLVPLALFYGGLSLVGIWGALIACLVWVYAALAVRLVARRRVPGLLVIAALGLTARTAFAFATHSVFLYFLQPTLTTLVVAAVFLASVPTGRPMAERLAADFCPLPARFLAHPGVRRFFSRLTLLWVFVQLMNVAITITLLVSQPVRTYVWTRSVISVFVTGSAIAVSTWWFKRSMRHHGITVVYAK
ncbi:MAG TPA: VC0807 family protein [Acidimicrobiales bacterium]|nr:VC0807 family protein [Acidimicrobiales bacterium]